MIKVKKLKCGITVAMDQLPEYDSASLGIWVRTGAVNEDKRISGISHLIEHMMFKGTENRSALKIAEDMDRIGGQMNAFTGKEATCYYIKTLSDNLDKGAEILFDMFTNSLFDNTEMNREKNVIREEMKMVKDMPDEDAMDIICELVMKGMPQANSILGTYSSLKGINHDTVVDYIRNQYTKDSIVISVAGRFNERKLCNAIEKKMGHIKAKKAKVKYPSIKYEPAYKVKVKDIEQSHLCLGTRSISMDDERYYPFVLLSNIMGGSMSSRLFQSVRERKGLAYSVFAGNSSFIKSGFFSIYAGIGHDKVDEAIEAIKEELLFLKNNPLEEEELSKAKEQLKSGYIFGQESVNARMFSAGKNVLLLGRTREPHEVIESIDKISVEDIEKVKKIICDMNKYSGILITNKRRDLRRLITG